VAGNGSISRGVLAQWRIQLAAAGQERSVRRAGTEPLLRASATLEVVTTIPVARVADIVLDHVATR
jgi:hypothetical protein